MDSVVAEGLTRRFGSRVVVCDVHLRVARGTIFGIVGQNGAGKSTTIRMLCGLLRPSGGRARICGFDVERDPIEVRRRVGYLPEEFRTYDRLTGREILDFTGRMHGLGRRGTGARARELLEFLEFRPRDADRLLIDYSMGMKKKILLACALIHDPDVLFLDEPFSGIDALSCRTIREALLRAAARGKTLFFSSHVLEVVEKLCTEIAILHEGRLLAAGRIEDIVRGGGDRAGASLEDVFVEMVGGDRKRGALSWMS